VSWLEKVKSTIKERKSFVCVGLDPELDRFPVFFSRDEEGVFEFCKQVVEITAPYCSAFKPQFAYFAGQRVLGALEKICHYIRLHFPSHHLILDAKRGDIGSTAVFYAKEAFDIYEAHACTIHPYMGFDSIEPFLNYPDRGVFILCRTSNPSGGSFQDLLVVNEEKKSQAQKDNIFLFEYVAQKVVGEWDLLGQAGLVMGATRPAELALIKEHCTSIPFLIPGIGIQGGNLEETVYSAKVCYKNPSWINSSRAILYPTLRPGETWDKACLRVVSDLNESVNQIIAGR
jgi:orotidine-5'-phosphate decarboxylase